MFILVIDWIINASGWRPASSLWRGCQINLVINGLALLTVAVTGLVVGGISWSFIIQLLVVIQISDFVPCTWQGIKYLSSDKTMFTKLVGNLFLEFSSSSRSYVPAGHMIVHASDPCGFFVIAGSVANGGCIP